MSYIVCNAVTHPVSDLVSNAVRTSVQNQNQNQRFWLRKSVVAFGEGFHPSNGDLGQRPPMDARLRREVVA